MFHIKFETICIYTIQGYPQWMKLKWRRTLLKFDDFKVEFGDNLQLIKFLKGIFILKIVHCKNKTSLQLEDTRYLREKSE